MTDLEFRETAIALIAAHKGTIAELAAEVSALAKQKAIDDEKAKLDHEDERDDDWRTEPDE